MDGLLWMEADVPREGVPIFAKIKSVGQVSKTVKCWPERFEEKAA